MSTILLPCPFCGNADPSFERTGTGRQSCIVICGHCGARHESSDEYERSGQSWNDRAALPGSPAPIHVPVAWRTIESAPKDDTVFLAYRNGEVAQGRCFVRDDGEIWTFGRTSAHISAYPDIKPTHWCPLPAPPVPSVDKDILTTGQDTGEAT